MNDLIYIHLLSLLILFGLDYFISWTSDLIYIVLEF